MTADELASLLRGAGAERVRILSHSKVSCACPLARWTHAKGSDSHPSFVAFVEGKHGDPIYSCQACHDEGSVRDLLLFLWSKGVEVFHWIEVLDAGKATTVQDVAEASKLSERLLDRASKADAPGFSARAPTPASAPIVERAAAVATDRPWYDYKCLAEADAVPEVPWTEYEPYIGNVPSYALERGLTEETCREWELGHDAWAKRLLFPIRDRLGRLVTISGRLYVKDCPRCGGEFRVACEKCGKAEGDHVEDGCEFKATRPMCERCGHGEPPKYMHRKGFQRNSTLYGEHRKDDTDGRVYVVEGHLDMLRLWQAGYRPAVAVLGTGIGEAQVEKIVARWSRVIVVPDGDEAGRGMGARIKRLVADRIGVTVKVLPEGTDPGGMTDVELQELLGKPPLDLLDKGS